jgi:hypothetical protein
VADNSEPSQPVDETPGAAPDQHEYLRRLVAARCPEIDIADLFPAADAAPPADVVPMSIVEKVLAVVVAVDQRLGQIESRLAGRLH